MNEKDKCSDGVEITSEMIAAAARVLDGLLWEDALGGVGTPKGERLEIAAEVLRAGLRARPNESGNKHA